MEKKGMEILIKPLKMVIMMDSYKGFVKDWFRKYLSGRMPLSMENVNEILQVVIDIYRFDKKCKYFTSFSDVLYQNICVSEKLKSLIKIILGYSEIKRNYVNKMLLTLFAPTNHKIIMWLNRLLNSPECTELYKIKDYRKIVACKGILYFFQKEGKFPIVCENREYYYVMLSDTYMKFVEKYLIGLFNYVLSLQSIEPISRSSTRVGVEYLIDIYGDDVKAASKFVESTARKLKAKVKKDWIEDVTKAYEEAMITELKRRSCL